MRIESVTASAYAIPTDAPESDGTLTWSSTTLVLAEVDAGGATGLGYTYADVSAAKLIERMLSEAICGMDAMATGACWATMLRAIRNQGPPGLASMAVAAVDSALWDLKGRLLGVPVLHLLGAVRTAVEMYGSGGFISYDNTRLEDQLGRWAAEGLRHVKMKIGHNPERDLERISLARRAIGEEVGLMVDANGAYTRKQALHFADLMSEYAVSWFEEPVSSDDLEGLRFLRDRVRAPMEIAAGEYGYDERYFRRLLEKGAVDVLQADATRCAGITGFMAADALCRAFQMPLSAHCAPALHSQLCCAAHCARNVEGFHDHLRIEQMLFDGAAVPENGWLTPDPARPGLGLAFKRSDAEVFAL